MKFKHRASRGGTAIRAVLAVSLIAGFMTVIAPTAALAVTADPSHVTDSLNGCKSDVLQSDYISNPYVGATQPKTAFICTDASYVGGNLGKGWNELDLVPYRLTESAGNAAPATQTYATAVALDGNDGGHPGYDVLTIPTLNTALSDSSCQLSSGPQLTKTPGFGGTDVTIYRVLTITQDSNTDCVIDFDGRIAVGAHLFPGASLHANTADQGVTKTGQDRSISVNEIEPQSVSKTMTASRGSTVTWTIHKAPTPASVNLGNTCATGNGSPSANVSVEVSWTKNAANADGPVTITAVVSATNPSHRTVQVTVDDKIFTGGTVGSGSLIDETTLGPTNIAANTTAEVGTHTFVWNSPTGTQVNDVATATYVDLDTGVPVPGTTTTSAIATIQNNGPVANNSAIIQDSESITGTGLQFSVNSTSGASGSLTTGDYKSLGGTDYTLGTKTVGPVYFESASQTASGSVTFNKTIYFTGPGDVTGSLDDTAALNGVDGFSTSDDASISITAHTEATLTLTKTTSVPADSNLTFQFTVTGPNNFSAPLSVDVNQGETSGSNTLGGLEDGQYTIHETDSQGFAPAADKKFTVIAGACTVTESISNSFGPASADATKVVVPGTADPTGYTFELRDSADTVLATGSSDGNGDVSWTPGPVDSVALANEGDYKIVETGGPTGVEFDLTDVTSTGDGTATPDLDKKQCTFTVDYPADADKVFSCQFTNTLKAHIIVQKVTDPSDTTTQFEFDPSWGSNFFLTGGGSKDSGALKPGDYSVSEVNVPNGWKLDSATCDHENDPATITLHAGETVTCTFNDTGRGLIIVKKVTDPSGATDSFDFTSNFMGDFSLSDGDSKSSDPLAPGNAYSVSETVPDGWDLTSATCDDGSKPSAIDLSIGETVTCTFTNTQRGNIIVEKQTDPNGSTQSFEFNPSWSDTNFNLTDGQQSDSGLLVPGKYNVAEVIPLPAGWHLTSATCDKGETIDDIDVGAGETVTCTFNNSQDAIIRVKKTVSGATSNLTFTFELRQGASDSDPGTGDDTGGTLKDTKTITANNTAVQLNGFLTPGIYQVCEILPAPGWAVNLGAGQFTLTLNQVNDRECVNVTVGAGADVTVSADNTPPPGGGQLTIGYWKNHASCKTSNGNQAPVLDQTLKASDPAGIPVGTLTLHGGATANLSPDCAKARNLLDKSRADNGQKQASDPIFGLAAQYLAARLNIVAGASHCAQIDTAITQAQALFIAVNFNGSTHSNLSNPQKTQANNLATLLDRYNNGLIC
jgi:Prealbumin-like fold domain